MFQALTVEFLHFLQLSKISPFTKNGRGGDAEVVGPSWITREGRQVAEGVGSWAFAFSFLLDFASGFMELCKSSSQPWQPPP